MIHRSGSSHIGSAFSIADILAVLYGGVLNVDPGNPARPDRDRFILSKGHAAAALYATLAERQFFPLDWLETYCRDGSPLMGHISHAGVPGVEVSTGALGHGLGIACGVALASLGQANPYRVFALLSDGECDEGSTWEAALFAAHHRLDGLIAIIDYNKIQSLGRVEDVLNLEPLADKWRAFGWSVRTVDGHNVDDLEDVLNAVPLAAGSPTCIIAHTIKGKGVSFMEDKLLWHYRSPNEDELRRALVELGAVP
jgi:transketolase